MGKAQKSSKLLERIAKLKNHSNNEQEWRAKLEEKRNKNTPKPSPTHSRQGTNDIVTESIIKKQKSKKNKKDTIKIKGAMHKKQTSASQQVIIQKLRQSADAWKKKQQKDGDATLQSLKTKKKILSKQERQRKADEYSKKMQIENNAWKQKREKIKLIGSSTKLNEKMRALQENESKQEWKKNYHSASKKETEILKKNKKDTIKIKGAMHKKQTS